MFGEPRRSSSGTSSLWFATEKAHSFLYQDFSFHFLISFQMFGMGDARPPFQIKINREGQALALPAGP